jgi:iron(III) transport system substrate-binding protein
MMRARLLARSTVPVVLLLAVAACSSGGDASDQPAGSAPDLNGQSLVIYTPNEQNMLDALIPAFEEQTGVKVDLVTAGTGELYQRIKSEAANPQGDVLFGGGAAQAVANKDMFEPYVAANDAAMTTLGENIGGFATPYQADGSNLLVNKDKIGGLQIKSYADLLNPALKGKIAFGDPTNSSSAFAQLTNILKAVGGDYESAKGWDFVKALVANLGGKTIGSSAQVAEDLANGEFIVALTYEPLSLNHVKAGEPVEIRYPTEGAVFLPSTVEIIKGAKHAAPAKAFADFITSEAAQQIIADKTSGRPLRDGIKKQGVPTLAEIHTVIEDGAYVASHRTDIVNKYKAILAANG